jgi:hypothetical protein
LLGSVLGGDPSVGFKSAIGVPEQYLSSQKSILEAQQKASERKSISDFQAKYLPNQFNETNPQFRGPVTPDIEARQSEIATAQAEGRPIFNIQNALQDLIRLPGTAQGPLRETITALQPKVQGNLLLNPNQQIIGGLPSFDAKTGLVSTPNVQGGRVNFDVTPASGFRSATAQNTLPPLLPNQEYIFNANQNVVGVRNADGSIQALTEATLAKGRAEGQARLETTPTNVIQPGTGRTVRTTEAQAIGGVTALSPAEDLAFKGYEPIRNDAFKKFQAASSSDASLQNLQNIINRGAFEPGKFAGFKAEAAAIATGLGIGGDRAKKIAVDSPLFLQSVADVASANIQDLVGATSDKDLQFSATRGPQITNPKESVQYYLDLTKVANQRKKDYFNYVTKNPVPDVVEKWSQTPQGSSSIYEDPKLRKYLPSGVVTSGPDKGKKAYLLPTGQYKVFD